MDALWQPNPILAQRSRLIAAPSRLDGALAAQLVLLITLGALAAVLTSIAASPIRLPGHAILRGALPLILGLSFAPRRTAGSIMSAAAAGVFASASLLHLQLPPLPAIVGLVCLGPALDLAMRRVPADGYQLYLRFTLAGLVANLIAFAVRMTASAPATHFMPGTGMGRSKGVAAGVGMAQTNPTAAFASFALFGAVAGLICGVAWFRARPRREAQP